MPIEIVHALGFVKQAAARVNARDGGLDAELGRGDPAGRGRGRARAMHDDQFPLVIWQTGSGTQSNMNANEVIAGRANEILTGHARRQVAGPPQRPCQQGPVVERQLPDRDARRRGALGRRSGCCRRCTRSTARLAAQAEALGPDRQDRPHPFAGRDAADARPGIFRLRLRRSRSGIARVEAVLPRLYQLAQGGTAVGTGLNAPKGFAEAFAAEIAQLTRLPFETAPNKFEALAAHDTLVELSGVLNVIAVSLTKIANDIRLLGSGPRCGLGELKLPENEPGSSIMPGKVNPTQCESLTMVAAQVMGNHVAVTIGGLQGHMELNVFKPLIGANVIRSINLLADGMESFTARCLDGMEPDEARIAELMNQLADAGHRARARDRLRQCRQDRQARPQEGPDAEGSGDRARPGRRGDVRPGGEAGEDARALSRASGVSAARCVSARGRSSPCRILPAEQLGVADMDPGRLDRDAAR